MRACPCQVGSSPFTISPPRSPHCSSKTGKPPQSTPTGITAGRVSKCHATAPVVLPGRRLVVSQITHEAHGQAQRTVFAARGGAPARAQHEGLGNCRFSGTVLDASAAGRGCSTPIPCQKAGMHAIHASQQEHQKEQINAERKPQVISSDIVRLHSNVTVGRLYYVAKTAPHAVLWKWKPAVMDQKNNVS